MIAEKVWLFVVVEDVQILGIEKRDGFLLKIETKTLTFACI